MPTHTKSKSSEGGAAARAPASGGAGAGRSAVTGKKLSKTQRRAIEKSADCIDCFLDGFRRGGVAALDDAAMTLGRVIRSTGGGRLEVTVLHMPACADEEVREKTPISVMASVPIGGNMKFKGGSQNKTDRANCMVADDVIVIRGGFACGKMTPAMAQLIRREFEKKDIMYPSGFFAARVVADAGAVAIAEDDLFDRTEELAAEEKAIAELRAEKARIRALRRGTAAGEEAPLNIDAI